MGIENIKYCKKCKRAFDVETNYDICPKCRYVNIDIKMRGEDKNAK